MLQYTLNYGSRRTAQQCSNSSSPSCGGLRRRCTCFNCIGDSENGLILPSADATPEEILEQAQVVGITQIEVV